MEKFKECPSMFVGTAMLAVVALGLTDAFLFEKIFAFNQPSPEGNLAFLVVCGIMGPFAIIMGLMEKQIHFGKTHPIRIMISHNAIHAIWENKTEILIGASFSSKQELVSSSQPLAKAIDQAVKTTIEKERSRHAEPFVILSICPTLNNGSEITESQSVMMEKAIAKTKYRRGRVVNQVVEKSELNPAIA